MDGYVLYSLIQVLMIITNNSRTSELTGSSGNSNPQPQPNSEGSDVNQNGSDSGTHDSEPPQDQTRSQTDNPEQDFDRSFVDNINTLLRQTAQRMMNSDNNNDANNASNDTTTERSNVTSSGTVETEPGGGNSNGAIVITVNYIFSDENDPSNPNRTGSLVLTLPNNSANRDPRTIEELIRLATQMAYTTIINGRHHEKGLSIETFESFPVKGLNEITSNECSICLESFIDVNAPEVLHNLEQDKSKVTSKKRKLNDNSLRPTASSDSELHSHHNASGSANNPAGSRSAENGDRSKLLATAGIEYPHAPVEMPCGHVFGQSCLSEWLKSHTTCPLCRTAISNPRTGMESNGNDENNTAHNLDFTGSDVNGSDIGGAENDANSNNNSNREGEFSNFRFVGPNGFDEFLNLLNSRLLLNRPREPSNRTQRTFSDILGRPSRNSSNANNLNDNSSSGSVFSNILTYFRRRQPESTLFPIGMASRRTNEGVESSTINQNSNSTDSTTTEEQNSGGSSTTLPIPNSQEEMRSRIINNLTSSSRRSDEEVLDFLNLRSLTDDAPPPTSASSTEATTSATNTDATNTTPATAATSNRETTESTPEPTQNHNES